MFSSGYPIEAMQKYKAQAIVAMCIGGGMGAAGLFEVC